MITDGLVTRNTGSAYTVLAPDGLTEETCKVKGRFRLKGLRTTNPVAVGDRVDTDGQGYITAVRPRRNYIIRRASNLSKEAHILASNLDLAVAVVTLRHPATSTTFLDRLLATAEAYGLPALIAINKTDLLEAEGPEAMEALQEFEAIYRAAGYDTLRLSAETGAGVDELRRRLAGKVSLMTGNSGVGKSTLINRLIPGLDLRTAAISDVHDRGMHTTTFSEMFRLPGPQGGWLIDTPGVKGFGTIDFKAAEVGHYFPEIFSLSKECRYGNCTHLNEPGCAVREALAEGRLAPSRFAGYLSILDDVAAAAPGGASPSSKYRPPQ